MKNSADLGGCYPPRPSASVDNTLLYLQNSSYPTQPHSIIAKYVLTTTGTKVTRKIFSLREDILNEIYVPQKVQVIYLVINL